MTDKAKAPLKKSYFAIGMGTEKIEGYTDGSHWNGWAKPRFTRGAIEAWLTATGNRHHFEGLAPYATLTIDLEFNDPDCETFEAKEFLTVDGLFHLYEIDGWTWDDLQESWTPGEFVTYAEPVPEEIREYKAGIRMQVIELRPPYVLVESIIPGWSTFPPTRTLLISDLITDLRHYQNYKKN